VAANGIERTVLVYRSKVLELSETFIASQASALQRYRPVLAGLRRVTGVSLAGMPVVTLERERRRRPSELLFQYLGYAPSFTKAVKAAAPDLVHAHFAFDGAECLPLVRKLQVPLVVTLHGLDVSTEDEVLRQSWSGRRYLRRRAQLHKEASLFICVSEFIRQQALRRGFPADKLTVHYIGVNTNELKPATDDARENVVLFVARLVEKKGLSYLIQAMRAVTQACPGVKLVVIGDGPLRARHQAEAEAANIACEFLGGQPHHAVQDWMRRAKVFAFPSVRAQSGDSEGLGIVLCEAFALGLPAVGFASGGIPEAIVSGTGLLAPERDVEQLGSHLITLLQNDALRRRISQAAREHVVSRFNLRTQTDVLEHIYDSVIARQPVQTDARAQVAYSK
jgi:glycosyltransferase involved in cell wall biosynthesis